jgi:hypothetical protein
MKDPPVGNCPHVDGQNNQGDQHHQQVGEGAGQGGQVVVADNFLEVAGDDRGRLGPAHQHSSKEVQSEEGAEDHQAGKQQGANGVHVIHGVKCDAALHAGGLVAEARGHPRVGALMNAKRKDENDKLKNGFDELGLLQTHSPSGGKGVENSG